MRYELYADSLFLVNFVMNLYILMLVNRSTFRTATPGRLLLGAVFGGISYLGMFLVGGPPALKLLLGGAAGSLGMLLIAFPIRGIRTLLKLLERTCVFSFCIGGALLFLVRSLSVIHHGMLTGIFGILGAGGILFVFLGRFPWEPKAENSFCHATLIRDGSRMKVSALIDSGNSLVEPISGKPVSVVDEKVFKSLWGNDRQGYRVIPYHSIGKRKGILEGYLLPELELEIDGMKKTLRNVYIAVSPEAISASENGEAETVRMIVNPCLLEDKKKERIYDTKSGNAGKNAV